ncbi:MAG TPA: zinc-dependent alcohol dehydrogenase family protein [Blastocatellia bacterium]|nr:zinc-dependent alcohol dehydrogenase family protein [Blastocatellia bacterium]
MKSIRFHQFGEPAEVLKIEDVRKPEPGNGEVLLKMLARPINPSDLLTIQGLYGALPQLPATPGFEGVGIIETLGSGVEGFSVGQRVIPLGTPGTWQEYMIVRAKSMLPVPDPINNETAAQFVVNPVTAWVMVTEDLKVGKGEWLLQTAAGSTLGRIVIQIGKLRGFKTINIVRRREQIDELKQIGANEVICSTDESIVDRVSEITKKTGVFAAIDAVGGQVGGEVARSLARNGVMLSYGRLSPDPIPLDVGTMIFRTSSVRGFWLSDWFKTTPSARQAGVLNELLQLMVQGKIVPPVEATYDLDDIINAVKHAQSSGRRGKVLLTSK